MESILEKLAAHPRPTIKAKELAAILGVKPGRIWSWQRSQDIPSIPFGRSRVLEVATVINWWKSKGGQ